MDNNFTLDLADEAATIGFGVALAKAIQPNLTIYLHGDLARERRPWCEACCMGRVCRQSEKPTYTLVEPYEMLDSHAAPLNLYHFDFIPI